MVCVSVRDRMREGVCTTAVNILISSISQFLAKEGVGRKEGRRKNRGPSDFKDKNILCYSGTIAVGGQLLLHIVHHDSKNGAPSALGDVTGRGRKVFKVQNLFL